MSFKWVSELSQAGIQTQNTQTRNPVSGIQTQESKPRSANPRIQVQESTPRNANPGIQNKESKPICLKLKFLKQPPS